MVLYQEKTVELVQASKHDPRASNAEEEVLSFKCRRSWVPQIGVLTCMLMFLPELSEVFFVSKVVADVIEPVSQSFAAQTV